MPGGPAKTMVLTSSFLLLLAIPRAASAVLLDAPSPGQDASRFTLDGKIAEAEAGKFTINTQDNILFHVRYDDKTEIKRADGSEGSAKDLRAGAQVHVVGDLQENGEIAASRIVLKENDSKKP
jgi:hypothetical protein